jgi:hypothetical protein
MMKPKHIYLSCCLFLITHFVSGQYQGGVGDGYVLYNSAISYLDGSSRTALFLGGSGNGYAIEKDSSIYLDGASSFGHFLGGGGDGFDYLRLTDYYLSGVSISDSYHGGEGDGSEFLSVRSQFLEGSVLSSTYQGGTGDGFNRETVGFRFLDGNIGCAIYKLVPGVTDSIVNGAYTQDIVVYYAFEPDGGELIVNDQSFPITGSPQIVKLTGLNPNGMPVDVTASFSDLPDCENTEYALFMAPDTTNTSAMVNVDAAKIKFSARPNPFLAKIHFSIELNRTELVDVALMTLNGQRIVTIFEGKVNGGQIRDITYPAHQLPQGVYLVRVEANGFVQYRKIVKLK